MIKILKITNFKSIKNLELPCSKINVFIGEPNTGKSNILETIGIFSYCGNFQFAQFQEFVRFEKISDLFRDEGIEQKIQISFDNRRLSLNFENGAFRGEIAEEEKVLFRLGGNFSNLSFAGPENRGLIDFKYYKYQSQINFGTQYTNFLLPPSGINLLAILLVRKDIREIINELCSPYNISLGLRPLENKIEFIRKIEDTIISYPYKNISDTFKRLIFHLVAIHTNQNSIIAFEEPESSAFPYYIKYFAEKIAMDTKGNQYFITTHNPYFLFPIVEKSNKNDIAINVVYYEDNQTKVKTLGPNELETLMELEKDVFFSVDELIRSKVS